MKYRLVIFDSDGTLADTLPWMRTRMNELAARHGFRKIGPEDYEKYQDLHGAELLRVLRLPLWKLPRVVSDMRRLMAEHVGELKLFAGMDAVLRQLHDGGVVLALVSSNSDCNVRRILGPANAALFAHFACGASIFGKAHKIRSVIRASGFDRPEALYIGDEIRDAHAARAAGIGFGAVAWGQHRLETLRAHGATECFRHVSEIADVVLGPTAVAR